MRYYPLVSLYTTLATLTTPVAPFHIIKSQVTQKASEQTAGPFSCYSITDAAGRNYYLPLSLSLSHSLPLWDGLLHTESPAANGAVSSCSSPLPLSSLSLSLSLSLATAQVRRGSRHPGHTLCLFTMEETPHTLRLGIHGASYAIRGRFGGFLLCPAPV